MKNDWLDFSPEVANALQAGRPVVALESTIIAHGMPRPENLETALSLERIIREEGATPATMAILGGRLKAGLTEEQIRVLAEAKEIHKTSLRDIGYLLSSGQSGATTVASTLAIARLAGIRIFATGGIGGVHRGAEKTFDISADLQALARHPVAVVSAGAKAILDLPRTLEYLETMGVPVIGLGTREFPAFFTRKSGLQTPLQLDSPQAVAGLMQAHWAVGQQSGVLVANPIPEQEAMDASMMEAAINLAVEEASATGVEGKSLTPYLLGRIKYHTGGASLRANIRLVEHNARVAARIAVAFATKEKTGT